MSLRLVTNTEQVFTCNLTVKAVKVGSPDCKECDFNKFAGEDCSAFMSVSKRLPNCRKDADGYYHIYKIVEIEEVEE